jgi:hypothetical protein
MLVTTPTRWVGEMYLIITIDQSPALPDLYMALHYEVGEDLALPPQSPICTQPHILKVFDLN